MILLTLHVYKVVKMANNDIHNGTFSSCIIVSWWLVTTGYHSSNWLGLFSHSVWFESDLGNCTVLTTVLIVVLSPYRQLQKICVITRYHFLILSNSSVTLFDTLCSLILTVSLNNPWKEFVLGVPCLWKCPRHLWHTCNLQSHGYQE